jgi:spermidine/putrescine transport system substrate-binding protein
MQTLSPTVALFVASLALVPLSRAEPDAAGKRVMTIFNFSEYIDPEVYRQFEKLHNCIVKETAFETPEEGLNKMVASGSHTFDVCSVGGNFMMPTGIAQGVLKRLDHSKLPNLKNLSREYQSPAYDPENRYSIPYQWGTTGIFIRKDLVPAGGISLREIFDEQSQLGRFVMMDSPRDMIGYANLYQGRPVNDVDLAVIRKSIELISRAKNSKNCMGFDGGIGGLNKVVAGIADYAIVYNGDAVRIGAQYPGKFTYVIPKEGGILWIDQLCIAKDAPNPDLAYAYLNYVLDAQVGAQISNWTRNATPNEAAQRLVKDEDRSNATIYPDPETTKRLHLIENLGNRETIRNDAWSAIKSN